MTNTAGFSTQQCAMVHINDVNTDILNPLFSILDLSNKKKYRFLFSIFIAKQNCIDFLASIYMTF